MSDSDEELMKDTPANIPLETNETYAPLLPQESRTKSKYELTYKKFMEWNLENDIVNISENVIAAYMKKLATELSPSTLWTTYSMLRSMLYIKNRIDISTFYKVRFFLKLQSNGYKPKKSKILTSEEIKKFLTEASDKEYLFTKVVLIFGISGKCRRQELKNLKTNHIRDLGNELQVKIFDTKTKTARLFVIPDGMFYEIAKKYMQLRPPNMEPFFINYQKGKCSRQAVGINKIGNQPKIIAEFLKLSGPELYTGHCFRRSASTFLPDEGYNTLTDNSYNDCKLPPEVETYPEHFLSIKEEVDDTHLQSIQNTSQADNPQNMIASTSTYNSVIENNFSDLKQDSMSYNNCTFNNCTFDNCTFNNCTFIVNGEDSTLPPGGSLPSGIFQR